jgi:hypothetical protein
MKIETDGVAYRDEFYDNELDPNNTELIRNLKTIIRS